MQEVHVVATAEQLVATRVPTPLQEIPQSISIISSEQIREQNSVDLGDVMENTPGIGVRQTNSLDVTGYSRAFEVTTYHVDGGSALKPAINNLTLYQAATPT
jgi:outer membrane receptor for ferric coprogen and ferric-rhodotorulic acid